MHTKKIRDIAKKVNMAPGAMERDELIRAIQEKEGNTPPHDGETDSAMIPMCTKNKAMTRGDGHETEHKGSNRRDVLCNKRQDQGDRRENQ